MGDLIDRYALLQELETIRYTARCGSDIPRQVNCVMDAIRNAPTVDAVEIVRCRECENCLIDGTTRDAHLCMRKRFPEPVKLDDFCSWGKRKGEVGE